ncbi:MAG: undecaprenyl-diphosphate phosphatase [Dehalococcoidia bacterium]
MDEWMRAALLGAVQAATEFLPVSSSGHLVIGHRLLGEPANPLAFDVGLHVGTLAAVLVEFRRDWLRMGRGTLALLVGGWGAARAIPGESRLVGLIAVATVPAVVAGLLLADLVERELRSPAVVALMLILGGVLLWLVDRRAARTRTEADLSFRGALTVGGWQVFALIPGFSRSGSTLIGGRSLGLERPAATRFSFLLPVPVIAGAAVLEIPSALADGAGLPIGPLLVGMLVAFAVGLVVIRFLLLYVAAHGFGLFAFYRVGLGILLLAALGAGWI